MADTAAPLDFATSDPLGAGRIAFAQHRWRDAFDLLSAAESQASLSGADLEALSVASFFAGRADTLIDILERAFKAHLAADDQVRAGYIAVELSRNNAMRGRLSIASAWLRRAERLLEPFPETPAHGYLTFARSELAREAGDIERAMQLAQEAADIGRRTGDADVQASGTAQLALLKIATGATTEGMALLEEAAIAAVNGELSPVTAGITACQMIAACRDLTDYRRANEWIEMTDKWCQNQSVGGFPGVCRVHRAEVVALTGGWQRAEEELRKATAELEAFQAVPVIADGLYAIGDIRRLQGDFDGAEEILRQAHAMGRSPQPALALIRLGSGKVKSATAAIQAALGEMSWDILARGRLLAAQVEIELAAGDVSRARAAVDELATLIAADAPPAQRGGLAQAQGRVLLGEGDVPGAIRELRHSLALWREVGSAYEIARVRFALSTALRQAGNEDDADLELRAARDDFERLGAKPDLAATDSAVREIELRRTGGSPVRMAFLFTDIVGSTRLAEALGDVAWERLLRWHDDMLRTQVARHDGRIVNWTGDGVFAVFASSRLALAGAIDIQDALAAHADRSGFAPPVRIGVHTADATQRGDDFSGVGVHIAARIAALAGGGQILASTEALADAPGVAAHDERQVEARGSSMPIRVATVVWR